MLEQLEMLEKLETPTQLEMSDLEKELEMLEMLEMPTQLEMLSGLENPEPNLAIQDLLVAAVFRMQWQPPGHRLPWNSRLWGWLGTLEEKSLDRLEESVALDKLLGADTSRCHNLDTRTCSYAPKGQTKHHLDSEESWGPMARGHQAAVRTSPQKPR